LPYNEIIPTEVGMMADSYSETIEKLRSELEANIAEIKSSALWGKADKLHRALNTIEELDEVPLTTWTELFGFSTTVSSAAIRPGEFIGMEALDAAKLYMEKKRDSAASLDEIMESLQKGGANTVTRDSLSLSLSRSTWDVVKAPGQELYQLVKYAPHVKRGRKKSAGNSTQEAKSSNTQATDVTPDEASEVADEKVSV
jgi:hypothetical protein